MSYEYLQLLTWLLGLALLLSAATATFYRERSLRLRLELDNAQREATQLTAKYTEALRLINERLILTSHCDQPEYIPHHKYTVLVTNGYTPDGAFVVVSISTDQPRVLPRALAALVVNAPPLEQAAKIPRI